MKYFDICLLQKSNEIILLGLTIKSFPLYISSVEKSDLLKKEKNGSIIVDRLLSTGNNAKRYVSFDFKDGKIVLKSIKVVNPTESLKQKSLSLLKKNFKFLAHSILTDTQKNNIENNIAF